MADPKARVLLSTHDSRGGGRNGMRARQTRGSAESAGLASQCSASEHGHPGGIAMIERYTLGLEEIGKTQVALVGGKGAQLGELSRIDGIQMPAGFCVTTDAFRRIMPAVPRIDDQLDRLSRLDPGDRQAIGTLSAEIRRTLEGIAIPDDLADRESGV